MRTGHIFAGGGGGLYADLILGHTPIFAVEWDAYACAVLRSRAADGWFPGLRVHEGDVRMFDPSEYSGRVDCIHAGFPCQDLSSAGHGAGIRGERSGLYREVLRVAGILRPAFIMLENSPRILNDGNLGVVLGDMAELGYDAKWTVLAASEIGAPHKRDRWWCLASNADGDRGRKQQIPRGEGSAQDLHYSTERAFPDLKGIGYRGWRTSGNIPQADGGSNRELPPIPSRADWWTTEPGMGRVVHGLANRKHQIRALGNGQVPLCAAVAWKILGGP